MCDVITPTVMLIASTAASAASALYAQDQQSKAVNTANENQRVAVHAATVQQYSQASRQAVEDRENQTVAQDQLTRERAVRLASARVSAGAAGIGGQSVDALMLDLAGKGLEASTTSEMNYARTVVARNDQIANIGTNQRSQLAGIQDARGPGALEYLGAGLRIADAYASTNAKTKKGTGP